MVTSITSALTPYIVLHSVTLDMPYIYRTACVQLVLPINIQLSKII